MSLNRTISWTAATRDMRRDRTVVVAPANLAERLAREEARKAGLRAYGEVWPESRRSNPNVKAFLTFLAEVFPSPAQ